MRKWPLLSTLSILIVVVACNNRNEKLANHQYSENNISESQVVVDTNKYLSDADIHIYDSIKTLASQTEDYVVRRIKSSNLEREAAERLYQQEKEERLAKETKYRDSMRLVRLEEERKPITVYVNGRKMSMTKDLFYTIYQTPKNNPCEIGLSCHNCGTDGWAPDLVTKLSTGNSYCVYKCDVCYGLGYVCQ